MSRKYLPLTQSQTHDKHTEHHFTVWWLESTYPWHNHRPTAKILNTIYCLMSRKVPTPDRNKVSWPTHWTIYICLMSRKVLTPDRTTVPWPAHWTPSPMKIMLWKIIRSFDKYLVMSGDLGMRFTLIHRLILSGATEKHWQGRSSPHWSPSNISPI